jgi:hypothetical protein
MSMGVLLVRPQSRNPARLAMRSPKPWVDPVVGAERCDNDVGNVGFAFGMGWLACQLDANLPELRR